MKHSATALALSLSLTLIPRPAKPNPAATLAVPACASFLPGCVVLGTIAIAGSLYWVYDNSQGLWVAPIIDPDNPEGWVLGEEMAIPAKDQNDAIRRCRAIAKRHGKELVDVLPSGGFIGGGKTYVCKFS